MEHPELAGTRVLPVEFSVGDGRRREYYAADGRRVVEDDDDADARADAIAAVAASYPAPVPTAADFPALPGADQAPIPRPLVPRSRRHAATSSRRRARAPAMKPEDFPALGGGGGQRRYGRCVHSVQGGTPWEFVVTPVHWMLVVACSNGWAKTGRVENMKKGLEKGTTRPFIYKCVGLGVEPCCAVAMAADAQRFVLVWLWLWLWLGVCRPMHRGKQVASKPKSRRGVPGATPDGVTPSNHNVSLSWRKAHPELFGGAGSGGGASAGGASSNSGATTLDSLLAGGFITRGKKQNKKAKKAKKSKAHKASTPAPAPAPAPTPAPAPAPAPGKAKTRMPTSSPVTTPTSLDNKGNATVSTKAVGGATSGQVHVGVPAAVPASFDPLVALGLVSAAPVAAPPATTPAAPTATVPSSNSSAAATANMLRPPPGLDNWGSGAPPGFGAATSGAPPGFETEPAGPPPGLEPATTTVKPAATGQGASDDGWTTVGRQTKKTKAGGWDSAPAATPKAVAAAAPDQQWPSLEAPAKPTTARPAGGNIGGTSGWGTPASAGSSTAQGAAHGDDDDPYGGLVVKKGKKGKKGNKQGRVKPPSQKALRRAGLVQQPTAAGPTAGAGDPASGSAWPSLASSQPAPKPAATATPTPARQRGKHKKPSTKHANTSSSAAVGGSSGSSNWGTKPADKAWASTVAREAVARAKRHTSSKPAAPRAPPPPPVASTEAFPGLPAAPPSKSSAAAAAQQLAALAAHLRQQERKGKASGGATVRMQHGSGSADPHADDPAWTTGWGGVPVQVASSSALYENGTGPKRGKKNKKSKQSRELRNLAFL